MAILTPKFEERKIVIVDGDRGPTIFNEYFGEYFIFEQFNLPFKISGHSGLKLQVFPFEKLEIQLKS
jgi:hypothetical protein